MNSINQSAHFKNVDDLLFRGKNKAYGAYELRRDYDQRLQRSFIYFILFTGILSVSAGIYNLVQSRAHVGDIPFDEPLYNDTTTLVHIIDPPKATELIPVKSDAFTQPDIVDKVDNPIELKSTQDIIDNDALISNKTQDGVKPDEPIAISSTSGTGAIPIIDEVPIDIAEVMPEFPGGELAMYKFLQDNLSTPPELGESGLETAKCILQFVVNEDGSISQIKTLQSDHPRFSQAATKVVKAMPRWKPGEQGGHKVKVYFEIPFSLVLEP